ncbi:MAG: phosphoadenosine phosphosulfate reductase [Bacteroidetes bacterium 47-18]|nr:MAG: phosphoadenosine phosphosulfate reductase [Bacteroidetes bacterium 47-18]
MSRRYQEITVFEATLERLDFIYTHFEKVYVSFSGGKDSGVLVNMAIEVARRHNRLPVNVLIIDLEAQYTATIEYISRMASLPEVKAYWICLPLNLRNAVSQYQSHWICWDESKRDAWVREYPDHPAVIKDSSFFPFFKKGMEFEEFVVEFGKWFANGEAAACLVGIRTDESFNRYRTINNFTKQRYQRKQWSTQIADGLYNFYPIYDWKARDIWIANGRYKFDYNRIYDLMYLAGLRLSQMRLCQPYGDDQRKGLYLYKILEPETWSKIVNRVEGANFGNRYSENSRTVFGNYKVNLPEGHTYKSYTKFLLSTMPPYLRDHYNAKIRKFLDYWKKYGYLQDIPQTADPRLEAARKAPSWRRICKVLLKNDYWCKGLSFSQTKGEMSRQLNILLRNHRY